jgi:hypothetical protein
VVQIWPGQTVTCLHTNSPGHIWTALYIENVNIIMTQQGTVFPFCVKDYTLWDSVCPLRQQNLIQKLLEVLVVYQYLPLAGDPCSTGELTRCALGYKHNDHNVRCWKANFNATQQTLDYLCNGRKKQHSTTIFWRMVTITRYSQTSNNGHCRGIQILSVIGGVR